jgi:hypothetical protein
MWKKTGSRAGLLFLGPFVWFFVCGTAFAEMSIETSVSRSRVAIGEEIILDIIVNNAPGKISKPAMAKLEGFSAYSQGHSQEISIVNNRSSSRSIFSYVLIANSVGRKVIGPFEVEIDGKVFKVAAVQVDVVDTPSTRGAPGQPSSFPSQGPASAPPARAMPANVPISNQDIFVKAWFDKDEIFVNEPVMLTYTIYTRLSSTYKGFEKEPVTTGFWIEDFPPEKTVKRTEQILNGSRYVVADIRKMALFPTQVGVFTVDPGVISATVEVRERDDFDSFFSYNIFGRRSPVYAPVIQVFNRSIPTEPLKLVVKALPEAGKPAGFNGAVGSYRIESSVDKKEVEAGNPVTYRVRVTGEGNLNTLQPPSLPPLPDFKIYDSSSSANISKNRLIVEGEKVAETVLVPKKAGTYTIPDISFVYFDPVGKIYKEIKTSSHTLVVKPSVEGEQQIAEPPSPSVQPAEKEDIFVVGRDIQYIKTTDAPPLIPFRDLHKNPFYWFLNAGFLVGSLGIMLFSKRREGVLSDLKSARFKRSHGVARRRLRAAAGFLKKDKTDEFYAEVSRALGEYFGGKLGISSSMVNPDTIEQHLPEGAADRELLAQVKELFNELAMGRFGRVEKSHEEMKRIYQMADRAITNFERVKLK